jgi:glutathione synthase/RimK-type ligase-like ATP-grasp enzyme
VLIINSGPLTPALVSLNDVEVVVRSIDDLAFTIKSDQVRVTDNIDGRDLAEFGLVQIAAYPRPTVSLVTALADYLDRHGVPVANVRGIGAPNKLVQYVRLAQAGLPVPETFYSGPGTMLRSYPLLVQRLDEPFILKALVASGGRHNFLIRNESEFRRQLVGAADSPVRLLAQRFIPNDTTYRLLVMGGEVGPIIKRSWAPGTHLATCRQGGRSALVDPASFDPRAQSLASKAAALSGSEIAGVNVIRHWMSGDWYILEANTNPAIASGVFTDQKIAAYHAYVRRQVRCKKGDRELSARSEP